VLAASASDASLVAEGSSCISAMKTRRPSRTG
jgi:hypothetical protein